MVKHPSIFAAAAIFLFIIHLGSCLECFICNHQVGNNGDCIKRFKSCSSGEDTCLTVVKWRAVPGMNDTRQIYVSKMCASSQKCDETVEKYAPYCTHSLSDDWTCAECCNQDQCNYNIST